MAEASKDAQAGESSVELGGYQQELKRTLGSFQVFAIAFAFFGAGMVVMAACSRIVFARSRDARFPAHGLMRRVSPRTHTPVPATVLIFPET